MGKIIFYPFSIVHDNTLSYLKTLQFAKEISAKVVCFSVVDEEEKMDDAYFHLLRLYGFYQTTVNDWQVHKVQLKSTIEVGEMESGLFQYLKTKKIDIMIDQPPIQALKGSLLEKLVEQNIQLHSF